MKLRESVAALALAFSSPTWAQNVSDKELKTSSHLSNIKAPQAWAYSTGAGVVVGVVDTGITATNPDLVGKIVNASGTNFVAGAKDDVRDLNGHGTHVSGIIAAAANQTGAVGVAPDAQVLPVRVASANGLVSLSALGQGIRRAAELAPIINVSIGGTACCTNDLKYAVEKGALIVVAAGNDGKPHPIWPARYAKETWAKGQLIAVGALDQNNKIASWSNRAGDTKDFFLVAPGMWIQSTRGDGLAYMSGTSMAAPQVTGAAALVKARWVFLKADQIADILFKSATDLGAPGTDPIYGRGLLNAEAAMKPIGESYVVNSSGRAVAASTVQIAPAQAYANAVKNTKVQSVELDEFGRDFAVDLSRYVVVTRDQSLSRLLSEKLDQAKHAPRPGSLSLQFDKGRIATGVLGSGMQFMQLESAKDSIRAAANLMQNPAVNLVPDHNYIGAAHELGHGLKLKAAAFTTAGVNQILEQTSARPQAHTTALSFAHEHEHSSIALTVSALNESGSFLGGRMSGFEMSGAPRLTFVTTEGAFEINQRMAAFAQLTRAQSAESTRSTGFAPTVSQANAWKLGLTMSKLFKQEDRLSLTLEQPLRVTAGKLSANLPVGLDEAGNVVFANKTIDLASSGHETQIRLDYLTALPRQIHTRSFVQVNTHPGNDATAKPESLFGVQIFKGF